MSRIYMIISIAIFRDDPDLLTATAVMLLTSFLKTSLLQFYSLRGCSKLGES